MAALPPEKNVQPVPGEVHAERDAFLQACDSMDARPSSLAPAVPIAGPDWIERMIAERRAAGASAAEGDGLSPPDTAVSSLLSVPSSEQE